ncbi:MAG TPA: hypothetical protein VFV25_01395 [Methylibium sp.]
MPTRLLRLLAAAVALAPLAAQAQTVPAASQMPMSTMLGFEQLRLPGSERLGLVGASLLFRTDSGWWLGPAVYGAATGERGGFFVGGAELQRRWTLVDHTQLVTGLYVGGGGGGAAPVGGGLMLRPALTLLQDFGGWQAGLSLSDVRFPSGDIHSHQLGLLLAWDGSYRYYDTALIGRPSFDIERSGLGLDRAGITLSQYRLPDGRHVDLVGVRAEQNDEASGLHGGIEAAAAAKGGAAGYMELLGSLGWEQALLPQALPSLKLGLRGAVGLGGGGGVPNGGGAMAKAAATVGWQLVPGWRLALEAGIVRGWHGLPHERSAQIWLATDLGDSHRPSVLGATGEIQRNEWAFSLQHVQHADRKTGGRGSLDTLGLKLDHYLGDSFYLSGQAHSAYAGGAGAYSVGLLGAGLATPAADRRWQLGAEVLAGAAGGGGVATGGGAIVQGLGWAAWRVGPSSQLRLGAGKVRSARSGGLNSPLVELAWSQSFGLTGR